MQSEIQRPQAGAYLGIFLIAAATLLLQVTFTRIFSVSIWYHFAFLVVSLALFGFGASGVLLAFLSDRAAERLRRGTAAGLFALTALLGYLGSNAIPFAPFEIAKDSSQILYLLLTDLCLTVPFVFAGLTVALLLQHHARDAGRLYAWDLVGAALGSGALFLALPHVGATGAIALSALLGFASAAALASTRARAVWSVAALLTLPLLVKPSILPDVRIDASKPLRVEVDERGGRVAFTKWNALSRIDVVERADTNPMILIDSAAMTAITPPLAPDARNLRDIASVGHHVVESPDVLIIGSGGGLDVQTALALGAESVTCVEINPIIIDLVTDQYRDHVGNVFDDPRVTLVRDEGRSFIDRTERRFDLLQLTLIDTWAAGASGAYSLTENYLYTTEAFTAYIDHLTDDGVLAITRWYFEAPRLATMAREALARLGVADAKRHVLVVQDRITTGFLVKRTPFTPAEVARAQDFAVRARATLVYNPLADEMNSFYDAFFNAADPTELVAASPINIDPVGDDAPFFFQMSRWKDINLESFGAYSNRNFLEPLTLPAGQLALVAALLLGTILSVVLLATPVLFRRAPQSGRGFWLGYFLALGAAFIAVEVILMQRFTLFLGHPTYSVTLVLFAILLFSGLGSAWSAGRTDMGPVLKRLAWILPVAILILTFAVPPLTRALIGLPLALRLLLALAFIGPVAFLMGMPFPLGVRRAGSEEASIIPWGWAANGCASVIGSVGAVMGAMTWNFSAVLVVAGVIYAAALAGLARRVGGSAA